MRLFCAFFVSIILGFSFFCIFGFFPFFLFGRKKCILVQSFFRFVGKIFFCKGTKIQLLPAAQIHFLKNHSSLKDIGTFHCCVWLYEKPSFFSNNEQDVIKLNFLLPEKFIFSYFSLFRLFSSAWGSISKALILIWSWILL